MADAQPRTLRLAAASLTAVLASCAIGPTVPPNPFAGAWATPERQQIAFRDDTVVVNPPDMPPTPMSAQSCEGRFSFSYGRQSRDVLLALVPHQADVRNRLAASLVRADYPIADLKCGEGASTYVLLDDRDIVVIHRDRDIAGIEQLTRL